MASKKGAAGDAGTNDNAGDDLKTAAGSISVRGPERGRWRAGRHFTAERKVIPLADLSDDEIKEIADDPLLNVRRVD